MNQRALVITPMKRLYETNQREMLDTIANEELLLINIIAGPRHNRCYHRFSTLLRTPGEDHALALGLLFSLGIIKKREDVIGLSSCFRGLSDAESFHSLDIELDFDCHFLPLNFAQAHPRYSSCGQCGSTEITTKEESLKKADFAVDRIFFRQALKLLKDAQKIFIETGGTHGAALFSKSAKLLLLYEDVGRHNAVDKIIGHMLNLNALPLNEHVLVVTSRASYEIVQKAAMADIAIIAAFGAVSSFAVEMAIKNNITLIGFLGEERFNIYTHAERILTAGGDS